MNAEAVPPPPAGPGEARRLLLGMALMLACCLAFAAMGACFRAAMQDGLPVPLVPFARGAFCVLVMLPWLLRAGPAALATRRPGAHLFRCAAGLVGFMVHMLAILWLPLADAVALMHARPLWALPLAFLLLGEKIGWDRAIAAAIGFAGVLVIAAPQAGFAGDISAGTMAALAGGLTGALVMIAVKTLSATEPPSRVVAWYAIASVAVWGPVSAYVWEPPSLAAALLLLAGSALAILGDFCASWAARRAPVGLLAPIEYVQIPASAAIGLVAFGEPPGWELLWGTLIMVAATLYLARSAGRQA
jgi:drug/metabolite transporter (DMT)-like permease